MSSNLRGNRKRKRSIIWDFVNKEKNSDYVFSFTEIIFSYLFFKVQCNYCEKIFIIGKGTSSILNHLKQQHNISECSDDKNILSPNTISNLDMDVMKLIIFNCLPLSLVETETFSQIFKTLKVNYVPMCIETIKIQLFKLRQLNYNNIMDQINENNSFAITTDGWTSNQNHSYLGITVHFITPTFQLKHYFLDLTKLDKSHTGEYLYAILSVLFNLSNFFKYFLFSA